MVVWEMNHNNQIIYASLHIFHKENVNLKIFTLIFTILVFVIYQNSLYKNHQSQNMSFYIIIIGCKFN